MKKVTFLIGLNDKDTKVQKISTILEASGIYKHNDASEMVVREKSFWVEVINFGQSENFDIAIKDFCKVIKIALNQESISVQYQNFNGELI